MNKNKIKIKIVEMIANRDLDSFVIFGLSSLFVLAALAVTIQNIYFVYVVWILFGLWIIGIGVIPMLQEHLRNENKTDI